MNVADLLMRSNVEILARNGILPTNVARDVLIYQEFASYERAVTAGTMNKGEVYAILSARFDVAERTVRKSLSAMRREIIVPSSCQSLNN